MSDYVKTIWQTGDVITAPLLNHIEDGISAQDIKTDNMKEAGRRDFSDAISCTAHRGEFDSVVCFGDSIFYGFMLQDGQYLDPGNGTMQQFASQMGLPLTNWAVSSATLTTNQTSPKSVQQQVYEWEGDPTTCPLILIDGGTNDQYLYGLTKLGEYGSIDTTTIYGAIHMIINSLLSKGFYPWQIVITTPIPKGFDANNGIYDQLRAIGFAMYETGVAMHCNVINGFAGVFEAPDNYYVKRILMEDGTHPTEIGAMYYANHIYNAQTANSPRASVTGTTLSISGAR